jgi:glycosyltransferase involved in cell wall biosynthesis
MSRIIIPQIALSAHGGTRITVEFANFAASQGHDVELLIPKGKVRKNYVLHPRVVLREFPFVTGWKYLDYLIFLVFCPLLMRRGILVANFFVTYFPVRFASFLFGAPFVYFVQDIESVYTGAIGRILNRACEWTYRSSRIIAANEYLAARLRERGTRLLGTIHIGPTADFYQPPLPDSDGKDADIVCFPRHEPRKGLDRLERILAQYEQVHGRIRVLGLSQDPEMLQRFAAKGYMVARPGSDHELIAGFDRARILLFTSYKDGFGLPPLEGMARGLPAVVYECGGPALYMQDGINGFLIADGYDARALHALHALLHDPVLLSRQRDEALKTAGRFSLDSGLAQMLAIVLQSAGNQP